MNTARVYTQCFECDYEAEFQGVTDEFDTAKFSCPNCVEGFQISNFSTIFEEGDND
mgnify:CR=1 FL=1